MSKEIPHWSFLKDPQFRAPEVIIDWLHDLASDVGYPWPDKPPVDDERALWSLMDEIRSYVLFIRQNSTPESFGTPGNRQPRQEWHPSKFLMH